MRQSGTYWWPFAICSDHCCFVILRFRPASSSTLTLTSCKPLDRTTHLLVQFTRLRDALLHRRATEFQLCGVAPPRAGFNKTVGQSSTSSCCCPQLQLQAPRSSLYFTSLSPAIIRVSDKHNDVRYVLQTCKLEDSTQVVRCDFAKLTGFVFPQPFSNSWRNISGRKRGTIRLGKAGGGRGRLGGGLSWRGAHSAK